MVLRVLDARISLKINVKKTKSLRLGVNESEELILGTEKIDKVDGFTFLGNIISKNRGYNEDFKSRIAKAQYVFFLQLKKVWKNMKMSLRTQIRTLEATMMTAVRHGSEAWAIRLKE